MTINPTLTQIEQAQRAGMAPRQEELGRWFREVEGPEDTQRSMPPASRLLTWLSERLVDYRTSLASARRVHRNPLVLHKCYEERDPVRHAAATGIWDHRKGRSEPCGII